MMIEFNAMNDVANLERFGRLPEKTGVNISNPDSKTCLKPHDMD